MCDDLLKVIGREGVRQIPCLGRAGIQGRGFRFASPMERGNRLARDAGSRLRLRGFVHRTESSRLERRLSRLVALDQCAVGGRADSLPRQRGDVAVARGCEEFLDASINPILENVNYDSQRCN